MILKEGNAMPEFRGITQNGTPFNSSELKNKWAVIYFYPKDFTPGCTAQACSFRDIYEDFKVAGAEVVGISSDSEASHDKFAVKHKLPFILLSDGNKKLQRLFGVPRSVFGLLPGRVTYIVNPDGKIVSVFNSMNANKHIEHAKKLILND